MPSKEVPVKVDKLKVYVHLKVNDRKVQDSMLEYYNAYIKVCNLASKVAYALNTVSVNRIHARVKSDARFYEEQHPGVLDRAIDAVTKDYANHVAGVNKFPEARTYTIHDIPVCQETDYDFIPLGNNRHGVELYLANRTSGFPVTVQFLAEWLNLPNGHAYSTTASTAELSFDHKLGWLLKYDMYTVQNTVVGIDLGTRFLAVTYDGTDTKFYRGGDTPLRHEMTTYSRRRLSLKGKGTRSARKRLKALSDDWHKHLEANIKKTVKEILKGAEPHTVFALEDIAASPELRERFSKEDVGKLPTVIFDMFIRTIRDEAQKRGHIFITVSKAKTSTRCPACGMIVKSNRKQGKHIYGCSCGFRSNDDRVAAINIRERGIVRLTERLA